MLRCIIQSKIFVARVLHFITFIIIALNSLHVVHVRVDSFNINEFTSSFSSFSIAELFSIVVFPYFNEGHMKKSFPLLHMLDYQVS